MANHVFRYPGVFRLESGQELPSLELAYSSFGTLNARRDNVVWVCHAFTGHPDVMAWWGNLFGTGRCFDPRKHFIICANMPGSCYGSTGPLSINPDSGMPFYHDFPQLTNRDMVRAFDLLRLELGLEKVSLLIGGSMGGQHVLEWAVMQPGLFDCIIPIATNARHSPWGIAFNETQRMAIESDPTWQMSLPFSGMQGMRAARAVAMLSYRSYEGYEVKQSEESEDKTDHFRAASYQRYMGTKIVDRFNAYTYWHLSKAMDSHNLARGRGDIKGVLGSIRAKALLIALEGDLLFPPSEQEFIARHIPGATYASIPSLYGHDGFLVEARQIQDLIQKELAIMGAGPKK